MSGAHPYRFTRSVNSRSCSSTNSPSDAPSSAIDSSRSNSKQYFFSRLNSANVSWSVVRGRAKGTSKSARIRPGRRRSALILGPFVGIAFQQKCAEIGVLVDEPRSFGKKLYAAQTIMSENHANLFPLFCNFPAAESAPCTEL